MIETLQKIIKPTLNLANEGIQRIENVHRQEGNPMTMKQLSECISGVVESKMVEVGAYFNISCIAPKIDSQSDIILNGMPLEIKTTMSDI